MLIMHIILEQASPSDFQLKISFKSNEAHIFTLDRTIFDNIILPIYFDCPIGKKTSW